MSILRNTAISVLIILLGLSGPAAAQTAWWNDAWSCRRSVAVTPPQRGQGVCSFKFPSLGNVATGGKDIHVVAAGKELPWRLISDGKGRLCHIAFPVNQGVRRVDIYYGNPKDDAPQHKWQPRRGLLLETRQFTRGALNSVESMRKTFDASAPVHGADFVDRVFHGFNPFGPTANYIGAYAGWLFCREDGAYDFATMASGPTYIAIDGNVVCGRGYWGGPSGRARVHGKVELKRGVHRFEYYMVHRWGRASAVAAWLVPGAKTYEVIPKSAFLDVAEGKQIAYEMRGMEISPDFSWDIAEEADLSDGSVAIAMSFTDRTVGQVVAGYERQWRFGDGVTASDRAPEHIYLRPGSFKVTLSVRLKGVTYEATQRLDVNRDWRVQTTKKPAKLTAFAERVRSYPFADMEPESLSAALKMYEETEDWKGFAMAARGLLQPKRLEALSEAGMTDAAVRIGRNFRGPIGDPDGAIAVLQRAEKAALSPPRKAKLALEGADVMLYYMTNVARARDAYRRLLNAYALADKYIARQAHIRIGDTWVMQAKYDEALAAYKDAESIKVATQSREHFGIGARAFETEAFLQRKEYDAARDALNAWQWEHPTDKLVGEWSVLMGRWGIATKDYGEAVKQLERLRKVNPRSPYVPEALLLLSTCYEAEGRPADAVGVLELLRKEYPESLLKEKAAARLQELAPKVRHK